MNHEGLKKLSEKADKHAATQRKDVEKARTITKRKERRLKPFTELTVANHDVADRARRLCKLSAGFGTQPSEQENKSPWIVLRKPDDEQSHWMVGRVSKDHSIENGYKFIFRIMSVDNEGYKSWVMGRPLAEHTLAPETYREATLRVGGSHIKDDEIMKNVNGNRIGKAFNPVGALWRYQSRRNYQAEIAKLQDTVDMFEMAAYDSDLNPHLVQPIAEAQFLPDRVREAG